LRAARCRPTTFSGQHWGASFSPDGNFVAFLKEANGVPQVWVKNLAEGDPIQVTSGDVPVRRLVWSPLNDRIVFSRFRGGLWSVPPLGGQPRRILEFGDAPKFSADGKRIVFTRGSSRRAAIGLRSFGRPGSARIFTSSPQMGATSVR
jgi:Tol biopolymer transport system component